MDEPLSRSTEATASKTSAPSSTISPEPLSSSDSAHFSHQGALQGASGGADQPAGL